MYLNFYGLKENPFSLATEPRFLYYSESHCEAMAHLLYGVRERKGIILMLGDAGTGKTTLVRATLGLLQHTRVTVSAIMNPLLSDSDDMLDAVLRGFGQASYRRSSMEMLDYLRRFLLQQQRRDKVPVIVVDEAQSLSRALLETLRLLSNLEDEGQRLVQLVFSGQPELNDMLLHDNLRALKQRIAVRCRLNPLGTGEIWKYINFRLIAAGGDGHVIFSSDAVTAIYTYSGGTPRIVNSLADNCLLAGFSRNAPLIDRQIVEDVARHLELSEVELSPVQNRALQHEIIQASSSWAEISNDLRQASVPAALKLFVEKMRIEEPNAHYSVARAMGGPSA
jgi:general secretion pathway protein A